MKILVLTLVLFFLLWNGTAAQRSCPNVFSCSSATQAWAFETYIRIQFDSDVLDSSSSFIDTDLLTTRFAEIYDTVAGLACDVCQRRVTNVERVIQPLPDYQFIRPEEYPDAERRKRNSVFLRVAMEQTGTCTKAFDNKVVYITSQDVSSFITTCPTGGFTSGELTCCCGCSDTPYPRKVSTEDLRVALGVFFEQEGLFTNVMEWQKVENFYGTTKIFIGTIFACFETLPDLLPDFLSNFIAGYNQAADDVCMPQKVLSVTPEATSQRIATTGASVTCLQLEVIADTTETGLEFIAPTNSPLPSDSTQYPTNIPSQNTLGTDPIPVDDDLCYFFGICSGSFFRHRNLVTTAQIQGNYRDTRGLNDDEDDLIALDWGDNVICPVDSTPSFQPPSLDSVRSRVNALLLETSTPTIFAIVTSLDKPITPPPPAAAPTRAPTPIKYKGKGMILKPKKNRGEMNGLPSTSQKRHSMRSQKGKTKGKGMTKKMSRKKGMSSKRAKSLEHTNKYIFRMVPKSKLSGGFRKTAPKKDKQYVKKMSTSKT
eukprot:scaffold3079_cov174-Amphora_coffeaeformis.AAC.32